MPEKYLYLCVFLILAIILVVCVIVYGYFWNIFVLGSTKVNICD